jgi:hypothetical protein
MAMDEKALSTVTVVAAMALTSFIDRLFPRYRACFPYCARASPSLPSSQLRRATHSRGVSVAFAISARNSSALR